MIISGWCIATQILQTTHTCAQSKVSMIVTIMSGWCAIQLPNCDNSVTKVIAHVHCYNCIIYEYIPWKYIQLPPLVQTAKVPVYVQCVHNIIIAASYFTNSSGWPNLYLIAVKQTTAIFMKAHAVLHIYILTLHGQPLIQ